MERHIPCKWKPEENRGSYPSIRQIDFKSKTIVREKVIVMIKGLIHQEARTIIKTCETNIEAPTYSKQILTDLKRKIDSNTIIAAALILPLSRMYRLSRQKNNKETLDLIYTLD